MKKTISITILSLAMGFTCLQSGAFAQNKEQKIAADAFITALMGRQWERVEMLEHPSMRTKITVKQWTDLLAQLESKAGRFVRHEFHSCDTMKGYADIIHYAHFMKDSIGFRVVVDTMNLIGGFWLNPVKKDFTFDPPPYTKSETFTEKDLTLGETESLPGTLSIPKGKGPFPAVVLIAGSGPNDRDETIAGNKPLRDIAWGLASQGIMVYRFDKRTKVYSRTMSPLKVTVQEEVINDVVAAVQLLRRQENVDTNKVFVLGHSLGALLAPEIAFLQPSVKGLIMLGAIARPLETVMAEQMKYISSRQDTLTMQEQTKLMALFSDARLIEEEKLPEKKLFMNAPASYYYDLHKRKNLDFIKKIHVPMFFAQGEKDYQAPMKDFEILKEALKDNPKAIFRIYRKCFHLFIETDAEPGPWNFDQIGHVTELLINDVTEWIRTGKVTRQ